MQVYTGKNAGSAGETNQGTRVVLDLAEDISKMFGRNITCNNFFRNLALTQKLLQKKHTMVATMRKNKPKLLTEFTMVKGQKVKITVFGFQQDSIIGLYCLEKPCSQYAFNDA